MSGKLAPNLQADLDAINQIPVISSILEVICRTTGMGFAAVARVTEKKWIACAVLDNIQFGLVPGGELKLETTICHEIRQTQEAVIIDHVEMDDRFRTHHTPLMYGFQSYISMPIIRKDGTFFGTLCAIDPNPAKLNTPEVVNMFKLYADLISFHLQAIEQIALTEEKLLEERQIAVLREQFIAILGHDLRNPVTAVSNVGQLMMRMPLDDRLKRLASILQDSSMRMKSLIENLLDFARGRLGDGVTLALSHTLSLEKTLNHVISELRLALPEREIITEFNINGTVFCDGTRVAQLFSNLLSNALVHGSKDTPVRVSACNADGKFTLSVANAGEQIPAAAMERLFHPFSRGEVKQGQQGLGLGLYIASEIAKAHGGTIGVVSTPDETRFTFQLAV
ncbi:GAF domain-containing sensor histidine kinase [Mucilaginibacter sp. SMC90]|uniref:GAF domain-containing sensor histidine kinase n=1 Tax=Mucilaginibacter sp. SMC90 TaxID=2929803 RepID=UPI001FB29A4A|nr:GAF domain-containing sensor histidine kinase [Mucilaginibacter sp. SMC90]UOE47057.1 GAF domain-containing sensor histidine kinase [Mucilaginibacter sp. SMC90]